MSAQLESESTGPTAAERERAAATGMLLSLYARIVPDAPAVIANAGTRTFRELNQNANRLARALRRAGLRSGDAVALLCGNRAEFVEVIYACQRSGLCYTPVNWHLTAEEAAYIVSDCGAKAVIADAQFAETAARAAQLAQGAAVRLAVGGPIAGFTDYAAALAQESGEDLEDPELGTRMLYTSGTTGRPKGVARPKTYAITRTPSITAATPSCPRTSAIGSV